MIGKTLGHYNIARRLRTDGRGGLAPVRVIAAIILIASWMVGASAQDSVSTSQQTQIIEKARETALHYTANLPNFISTETIRPCKGFTDVEARRHTDR
jgi:hypothetical protein